MRTKELFGLLLWSTFGSLQAFAQVSYLHSDTQNAAWTVMPEEEVGKDMLRLTQNGYQNPKAVKAVVSGPVTPECPGSILQLHPDCTLVADEEALSLL